MTTTIKPRDVQVLPLGVDTLILRSRTWDRLKFEIEYARERGTTANAFLIQGDKIALFDPPGESFTEIFLESLQQRLDPRQIDYLILAHVNPNRAVTIKALLELAPQITFVCSNPGAIALRSLLPDKELNILTVRGEETLDLGKGHRLQFITTPIPRWSDEMCTYDPQTEILFTDKLFGAHICSDQVLDEGWTSFSEDRRYYFDAVMAAYARQVDTALEKLAPCLDLEAKTLVAPGHGPMVRYGLRELVQDYHQWSQEQRAKETMVTMIYASAYGNTAILGQAIARGITKAGVAVETINCEFAQPEEIKHAIAKSAGFALGSPTLGGHLPTPVQTALGIVLANASKSQLAGVFGSFGWSGEAVDLIEGKLRDAGYTFGFETIRVKFKPTEVHLQLCEEAGVDFAQAIRKAKKLRAPRQPVIESQAARTEQAVGRIIGSLCVLSAKQGEVATGMLADWVSQATFNPPGIMIAVGKERAIESLLYPGSSFVLNILAEGKQLRKHFMKSFAPGEDRFAGVETELSQNGCPILTGALAYLECQVEQRMECGDHWLVYATAENGKVLQQEGVTAVHYRKSGNHY
ncbi:MAG: flavin oxidoreductase [Coleofasciculaceae cyanobacterium SM2_1_6]|nr:flavin oxidoreductase [Coleofasciculaceae cyanobacterium SM2_1_6]